MINTFLLLLLGHLIGDFVLQTSKIAANKNRNIKYLFFHTFIIFLCEILVILPSWNLNNLLFILLLWVMHFAIDFLKYKFNKTYWANTYLYFIADQIMHLLSLALVSIFISVNPIIDTKIVIILVLVITDSYLIDIFNYMVFKKDKKPYKRDILSYILKGLSYPIMVLNLFVGIAFIASGFLYQFLKQNSKKAIFTYILVFIINILALYLSKVYLG